MFNILLKYKNRSEKLSERFLKQIKFKLKTIVLLRSNIYFRQLILP
jgi:hypothetical protein